MLKTWNKCSPIAKVFNQILNFDTGNVTNMRGLLELAENFNSNLNFSDTQNVTTMEMMFNGAYKL